MISNTQPSTVTQIDPCAWVYLDYSATTPIHPQVAERITADMASGANIANAHATHGLGLANKQRLEAARADFAQAVGADPREIVFTSGATEADNLAIKGVLTHHQVKQPHVITVQTEHKAVLDPVGIVAKQGVRTTVLPVDGAGQIDWQALEKALQQQASLVSVMAVNNETGVIQPIADIAQMVHYYQAKLHVDAAQALGKMPLNIADWQADLVSFSGHKIYAPQGIGALYVKRLPKVRLQAQIHGGGQERGRRSGTTPLTLVRAFALAAQLAQADQVHNARVVRDRYQQLIAGLPTPMALNVSAQTVPHIISIDTAMPAHAVMAQAAHHNIAISAGSACQAESTEGSHVLNAMGLTRQALQSIRVSFSYLTTPDEVDKLLEFLRSLSQRVT